MGNPSTKVEKSKSKKSSGKNKSSVIVEEKAVLKSKMEAKGI